ncbi:DNA methyltransferase, partial [Janibacter melonis]|nr:DNA methyltransferase [Janibacter melonis]
MLRAVLLAATLPADTSPAAFWAAFRSEEPALAGITVHDPFLGGGTTLVEAARLGATVTGADIDPLAVTISRHQLNPPIAED